MTTDDQRFVSQPELYGAALRTSDTFLQQKIMLSLILIFNNIFTLVKITLLLEFIFGVNSKPLFIERLLICMK